MSVAVWQRESDFSYARARLLPLRERVDRVGSLNWALRGRDYNIIAAEQTRDPAFERQCSIHWLLMHHIFTAGVEPQESTTQCGVSQFMYLAANFVRTKSRTIFCSLVNTSALRLSVRRRPYSIQTSEYPLFTAPIKSLRLLIPDRTGSVAC